MHTHTVRNPPHSSTSLYLAKHKSTCTPSKTVLMIKQHQPQCLSFVFYYSSATALSKLLFTSPIQHFAPFQPVTTESLFLFASARLLVSSLSLLCPPVSTAASPPSFRLATVPLVLLARRRWVSEANDTRAQQDRPPTLTHSTRLCLCAVCLLNISVMAQQWLQHPLIAAIAATLVSSTEERQRTGMHWTQHSLCMLRLHCLLCAAHQLSTIRAAVPHLLVQKKQVSRGRAAELAASQSVQCRACSSLRCPVSLCVMQSGRWTAAIG